MQKVLTIFGQTRVILRENDERCNASFVLQYLLRFTYHDDFSNDTIMIDM